MPCIMCIPTNSPASSRNHRVYRCLLQRTINTRCACSDLLPLDDPQGSRHLKLDSDSFDWGCGLAQLAKMILSVLGGSGGLGDIYCTRSCGVGRIPSCDFGGLPRSSSSCGILPSPQDWSIYFSRRLSYLVTSPERQRSSTTITDSVH